MKKNKLNKMIHLLLVKEDLLSINSHKISIDLKKLPPQINKLVNLF